MYAPIEIASKWFGICDFGLASAYVMCAHIEIASKWFGICEFGLASACVIR